MSLTPTYASDRMHTYGFGVFTMPASAQNLPNPAQVKNFPLANRKARIVKDRNFVRVIERVYYWDSEKKRGSEKRIYLGYIVDGSYYTNEQYVALFNRNGKRRLVPVEINTDKQNISSLDTLLLGEFPIYYYIARDVGLIDDLNLTWGARISNMILSVAFHWLSSGDNAAYLFESWSHGKSLPYMETLTAKDITGLFRLLISTPGWRKTFFQARINRLPEHEMLSYDATEIAFESNNVSFAQWGKGKEGGYQKQIGLIILYGHYTNIPVLFRVLPGNIADVTTVPDMLYRFEEISESKKIFSSVLDRGYFSWENVKKFIDLGYRAIFAAKTNLTWVIEAMEIALPDLWMAKSWIDGKNCYGHSVAMTKVFEDGIERTFWVQVYRDESRSKHETACFFEELKKLEDQWRYCLGHPGKASSSIMQVLKKSSLLKFYYSPSETSFLVRNNAAIDDELRYAGFFCNVSTFECTPKSAMIDYSARDAIEKSFKAGKSYAEMDVVRSHSDETSEGRFIISFCCMTILSRLYYLMNKKYGVKNSKGKELPPIINDMTFKQIRNYLHPIRVCNYGVKGWGLMEITAKQKEIVARLGMPNLYDTIPDWSISSISAR